jgi:hypothetical protein
MGIKSQNIRNKTKFFFSITLRVNSLRGILLDLSYWVKNTFNQDLSVKWFFQARWSLAALVVIALSPRTNGDIICDPGYTLVDDNCTICVASKHKQESGNMPCRSCPVNSDSPVGSTAQGE